MSERTEKLTHKLHAAHDRIAFLQEQVAKMKMHIRPAASRNMEGKMVKMDDGSKLMDEMEKRAETFRRKALDADTIVSMTTRIGADLEPALDGLATALSYTEWLVLLPERDGLCRWLKADGTGTAEIEEARRFKASDHVQLHAMRSDDPGTRILPLRIRMEVPEDHEGWKL